MTTYNKELMRVNNLWNNLPADTTIFTS